VYSIFVNPFVKILFFPWLASTKRDHSTQTFYFDLWFDVQSDHSPNRSLHQNSVCIHYLSISRSTTIVAQSLKWISMGWKTGVIPSKGRDCTLSYLMLSFSFMDPEALNWCWHYRCMKLYLCVHICLDGMVWTLGLHLVSFTVHTQGKLSV